MRFAYYIPRTAPDQVTPELLKGLGLADRFHDCFGRLWHERIVRSHITANGPDGYDGAFVYANHADPMPSWKPAAWKSAQSDNGKWWLCWHESGEPEHIQRLKTVEGADVELLDGHVWKVPTIRRALAIPNVPCSYVRVNGQFERRVLPDYRTMWEESGQWAIACFAEGMSEDKLASIALRCIAINYRIGDEELRALDPLFGGEEAKNILRVAIDAAFFEDALEDQKKRDLLYGLFGTTSMPPGSEGSTRDIESHAAS